MNNSPLTEDEAKLVSLAIYDAYQAPMTYQKLVGKKPYDASVYLRVSGWNVTERDVLKMAGRE